MLNYDHFYKSDEVAINPDNWTEWGEEISEKLNDSDEERSLGNKGNKTLQDHL